MIVKNSLKCPVCHFYLQPRKKMLSHAKIINFENEHLYSTSNVLIGIKAIVISKNYTLKVGGKQ